MSAALGRSPRWPYRELARNRKVDGRYQPWFAHNQAYLRRRRAKLRRFAADAALREVVAGKLAKHWSPAQISRWLRRRYPRRRHWHVCTETIYEAIYRGLIVSVDRTSLRTGRTYRRRRGRGRTRDGALKQSTSMKSIHDRPAAAQSRRQAGHWEGDLIIGAGQRAAIATSVERKFRATVLVPVPGDRSAQSVGDALISAFSRLPVALRRTLTWDQGNELFHHQRIEQHIGLQIYFADPTRPGNGLPTRTPTACSASTFPRELISAAGPPTSSTTSPQSSTIDPDSASAIEHRQKPCNDGSRQHHDDDSQRSLETARSTRSFTSTPWW